jgi:hypothetical protein
MSLFNRGLEIDIESFVNPQSAIRNPQSYFFPLYVTLQTFFPPSSTTSNDPSRIIRTPTGRPHTSWPDSSGTQPVRKFS